MSKTVIPYRSDIDGLRGIAITLVILFHFFPNVFPGGFIGVDIFFVISGYLITSIILQEYEQNIFTLKNFYIRRIRRLFPALLLVLFTIAGIGYFTFFSNELRYLGKHILGTTIFIENLLYMSESTYFNQSHKKILLNFWSLSLEEQFYLLWPLFILFFIKRGLLHLIIIGLIVSFMLNITLVNYYPNETFFLLVTRSWELLFGALLAFMHQKNIKQLFVSNLSSYFGILLIVIGLLIINKSSNFPGIIASLPTIGTALLIAQGGSGFFNQFFLSNKLIVYVGKISYPLYLWHWPLLALSKMFFGSDLSTLSLLLVLSCAIVIAILTYHLLEKKIAKIKSNWIIVPMIFLLLIVGSIGTYFYFSNGIPSRGVNQIFHKINFGEIAKANKSDNTCNTILLHAPLDGEICFSNSTEPELLIIGDSHAVSLFTPLINNHIINAGIIAGNSCYFYPNFSYKKNASEKHGNHCAEISLEAIKAVKNLPSIKTILIVNKMPSVSDLKMSKYLLDGKSLSELHAFKQGNFDLITSFQNLGKNVIFMADVPIFKKSPADCERRLNLQNQLGCELKTLDFINNRTHYIEAAKEIASNLIPLKIYDPIGIFCDDDKCSYKSEEGDALYIDNEHISPVAAYKILIDIVAAKW